MVYHHSTAGCLQAYRAWIWWYNVMETLSALLALCEGNPSVTGSYPHKVPVMQSFDVFFGWTRCWTVELLVIWDTWDSLIVTVMKYRKTILNNVVHTWKHQWAKVKNSTKYSSNSSGTKWKHIWAHGDEHWRKTQKSTVLTWKIM